MSTHDLQYNLVRRKRKTLSIVIENNGDVNILAPLDLPIAEIEIYIAKKRHLIEKYIEHFHAINSYKFKKEFINGEEFLYLGRHYRLFLVEEQDRPLKMYQGNFYLEKDSVPKGKEHFKTFYKEKGVKKLEERIERYKHLIGVNPKSIKVMDLQNRWASCSEIGNLNFHWKLLMSPIKIIDYIVVHELSHLKYHNHSIDFWNLVEKVMPDYLERKQWLNENGIKLNI